MRGIEYLELVPDSVMPRMLDRFSSEWDDVTKESVCLALMRALEGGGAVIAAYISEEEDDGVPDGGDTGDYIAVDVVEDEPEEKAYDWYIEDEEDEPPCRSAVGLCAVDASPFVPEDAGTDGPAAKSGEHVGMTLICVAPGFRRKGIGKGLFRRAVRLARGFDARRLYISAPAGTGADAFLLSLGCEAVRARPAGSVYSCPLIPGGGESLSFGYPLFPGDPDGSGIITIEEYQTMAGAIIDSLPREFFNRLNGGAVVRPEKKIHAKSVPGAPMYVMGEYTRSSMMGRMIYLYYGSFAAVYGGLPRSEQRELLRGIIVHEFRHHMEWLSGTRELEEEDERGLRAYLLRFAKKGKKRGSDPE